MKKYLRFAENYILLLASATLGLFLLLFAPKDGGVSETENRARQAFPELKASSVLSGEYMDEFESFLSVFGKDHFVIALQDHTQSVPVNFVIVYNKNQFGALYLFRPEHSYLLLSLLSFNLTFQSQVKEIRICWLGEMYVHSC